jgi:hypothetical protein
MGGDKGSRSEPDVTHWAQVLGEARYISDGRAAQTTTFQENDATRTTAVSAERCPGIVAGIRRLVDAHNAGAGRVILTVQEPSGERTVTIAGGCEGPSLTAALGETLVCIRASYDDGLSFA